MSLPGGEKVETAQVWGALGEKGWSSLIFWPSFPTSWRIPCGRGQSFFTFAPLGSSPVTGSVLSKVAGCGWALECGPVQWAVYCTQLQETSGERGPPLGVYLVWQETSSLYPYPWQLSTPQPHVQSLGFHLHSSSAALPCSPRTPAEGPPHAFSVSLPIPCSV